MDSFALVIFGITSNLAHIKLIPALYDMENSGLLPSDMIIIGIARKSLTDADLQQQVHAILHAKNRHHTHDVDPKVEQRLIKRFRYLAGEAADHDLYVRLKKALDQFAAS